MSKTTLIQTLKKVKLVIGNGFDLHCGLHTKYSDYYCKHVDDFLYINSLYDDYVNSGHLFEDDKIKNLSVWSVFFALNSSKKPKENKRQWCDIEKLMLSSFLKESDKKTNSGTYLISNIHWDSIKKRIGTNTSPNNHIERFVVDFVKFRMKLFNTHIDGFYRFLLNELKIFEHSFGEFVNNQIHVHWFEHCNPGQIHLHTPYIRMAIDTISELCNEANLVAIDSFNYGSIYDESVVEKIQNINGNTESPIFGVDSIFKPKDERFIFTKTGRRIDSDLLTYNYQSKPDFENVVIFGHSLNEADYNYFFPLFDKINLSDTLASGVVVFAYSIFEKENEDPIRDQLRKSLSDLLYAYAVDRKLPNPNRFLDSLSTQKRIVTYEILTLDRKKYGFTLVDDEWNKIYAKINSLEKNKENQ